MDTDTILEIIKIIDTRIEFAKAKLISQGFPASLETPKITELLELKDHLQECIEGQVNAMENQTVE